MILEIKNLAFSWQGVAADLRSAGRSAGTPLQNVFSGVSFSVARGESVAIIGANGAGKSTLLRCVAGILAPTAGEVFIDGKNAREFPRKELAKHIAFLPQGSVAPPALTVREVVETGRYPYFEMFGHHTEGDAAAVDAALEITGTTRFAKRRFDELSGGERQRVLLAAAIAQDAPILLLDEPFTFLDPAGQAQFSEIIRKLREERGVTVVTVTHDLARARADGCRVIGLADGKKIIDASCEQAFTAKNLQAVFGCSFDTVLAPETNTTFFNNENHENHENANSKISCLSCFSLLKNKTVAWCATIAGLILITVATIFAAACFGKPFLMPFGLDEFDAEILYKWRLPRAAVAFAAGAALSLAGLVFQAMFRNPLATPYVLGVSGGAAFGAIVATQLRNVAFLAVLFSLSFGTQGLAFAGAMLSVAVVYGTFRAKRRVSMETMLLAGVGCSFLFSSLIMLFQYICEPAKTIHTLYWMMGGIPSTGRFGDFYGLLPALALGIAAVFWKSRELDIMLLGDEVSVSRGVDLERTRKILFLTVSLMTAAV
ncbi:MAG: iron chelate uptake ABC transporter family permease subunit, partial [Kiritimatiellaeota bacterium]|nr:iron chelate uptake ABC transporter family permease subunit [Kiritimatiellota bacterium]